MENLRVIIKRSKNVHAWSNQFIGESIKVEKTDELGFENGYKVVFADNAITIPVSNRWITGIIYFEDCKIDKY